MTTVTAGVLLAAATADHDEHRGRLGPLPAHDAGALVRLVTEAGLTGRGGAGFPTGAKLATLAARRRPVVVGNGAEGEPASSKDRLLLSIAPHLVLDGLLLAARAVRASTCILYAPADLVDSALAPAVLARRDRRPVRLVAAADGFVAGQETAVVAAVNGRPARPAHPVPAVFDRGVDRRPTLVQNVETLAQLALLARYGADWFRSWGTDDEPGTRLLTVSGAVVRPGVYELPGGAPLGQVLAAAGGASTAVQALLVGGYHGGWVPWSTTTRDLPLTGSALAPYDAAPGAGVVIALPADRCGLRAGADLTRYLAGQSSGQCGPCRFGLPTLSRHLDDLARGRTDGRVLAELDRVAAQVTGRGACKHPDGTTRLVASTLRCFAADVAEHGRGRCLAAGTLPRPRGRR